MRTIFRSSVLLLGALLLAGCPAAISSMNQNGSALAGHSAPPPPAANGRPAIPYAISATNRGGFTEFTIRNDSSSNLTVRPEEIAMLVSASRQQVHYNPREVVIDLPPDCQIPPGQSVTGRARYFNFPDTTGNRLVFNPGSDARGRFAVVTTIGGPTSAVTNKTPDSVASLATR